jgi:hypothetical protein
LYSTLERRCFQSPGIIGTNIFLDKEAPQYGTGYGVALGVVCLGILSALFLEWRLRRLKHAKVAECEDIDPDSVLSLEVVGEKSPFFRYTL